MPADKVDPDDPIRLAPNMPERDDYLARLFALFDAAAILIQRVEKDPSATNRKRASDAVARLQNQLVTILNSLNATKDNRGN